MNSLMVNPVINAASVHLILKIKKLKDADIY